MSDTAEADSQSPPSASETIFEFVRPWLYPKQLEAIYDSRRFSLIEASTKAGKTVACIIWLIEKALFGPGAGANYWWVAPVGAQADIAFGRMLRFLPQGLFHANRTTKTIVLVNGAVIWCKGADRPDSLYGDDVHAAVIDEASRFKEDAWLAVRTTLTFTRGPIRIIGNVKGRRNWFYKLARRAQQGALDMGYHRITAHDAVAAGVLAAAEIESARRDMPEHAFRELYLAEPSEDEGNPFGVPAIAACIAPLSGGEPRVWGWDLAKKVDYTVGIALDDTSRVCRFERWQGRQWDQTIADIRRLTGLKPALVDSTGIGDPIVDLLQKTPGSRFEGYHFTPRSKQQLMEGLASAIQSKGVTYPAGPPLPGMPEGAIVFELNQFEYQHSRTGVRYSSPEGLHDDCVCALALAKQHFSHAPPPMRISDKLLELTSRPIRGH